MSNFRGHPCMMSTLSTCVGLGLRWRKGQNCSWMRSCKKEGEGSEKCPVWMSTHQKITQDIHFRASSIFETCFKPHTKITYEGKGRASLEWGRHAEAKNRRGVKVVRSVWFCRKRSRWGWQNQPGVSFICQLIKYIIQIDFWKFIKKNVTSIYIVFIWKVS